MSDESDDIRALTEFIQDNQELEKLETILDDFNVFVALGVVDNEVRHSTFLSWLLNPAESHGLGDYFLSMFLKQVALKATSMGIPSPSVFDIEGWHFDDAEVLREWRNIDVLIRCGNPSLVWAVENKVWSEEHDSQLQRYADTVNQEYPGYEKLFVYLTVEGEHPSDSRFVPVSHSEVVQIIERLVAAKHDKLGDEVSSFLSHYIEMLRRYIMKDSQVQEICRKIYNRHKRALDLIFDTGLMCSRASMSPSSKYCRRTLTSSSMIAANPTYGSYPRASTLSREKGPDGRSPNGSSCSRSTIGLKEHLYTFTSDRDLHQ